MLEGCYITKSLHWEDLSWFLYNFLFAADTILGHFHILNPLKVNPNRILSLRELWSSKNITLIHIMKYIDTDWKKIIVIKLFAKLPWPTSNSNIICATSEKHDDVEKRSARTKDQIESNWCQNSALIIIFKTIDVTIKAYRKHGLKAGSHLTINGWLIAVPLLGFLATP